MDISNDRNVCLELIGEARIYYSPMLNELEGENVLWRSAIHIVHLVVIVV